MAANKKLLNKQGIAVIVIAVVILLIVITFIFSNPVDENKDSTKVLLEESGEPSYLNLSVPNSNQKEDSLSLIDKLDKIKTDSINNSNLKNTGLDDYDQFERNKRSRNTITTTKIDNSNYRTSAPTYSSSIKKKNTPKYNAKSFDEPLENREIEDVSVDNKKVVVYKKESGFFKKKTSFNNVSSSNDSDLNILACIHTNQTVMNNQRVKFRSTKEFIYKGQKYPINTILYGLAQIKPNRLIIKINKINQTDIKLEVYDSEDSEPGVYVLTPNLNASLQKELKKEGVEDDDLRNIPFSKSLKNIFEKKVREEKVQLLNNYKVLIKICKDE